MYFSYLSLLYIFRFYSLKTAKCAILNTSTYVLRLFSLLRIMNDALSIIIS